MNVSGTSVTEARREPFAALVARHAPREGSNTTAIERLSLVRLSARTEPAACCYDPALIVVAQGRKTALVANERYDYDPAHYLLTSVMFPATSYVVEATPGRPFLCVSLSLDLARFADLVAETAHASKGAGEIERALGSAPMTRELLDAIERLVRLLDAPRDIAALAPLVEREICYRLLSGPGAPRLLARIATEGRGRHVSAAVDWLNANYARPLRISALAERVNMSVSSLHHHFKTLTAMSPLQYQKQLRLQAARRMMLETPDVAAVCRRVGYDSPSQFSRDYRRLYGHPPLRDIALLRSSLAASDG